MYLELATAQREECMEKQTEGKEPQRFAYETSNVDWYGILKDFARENRKNPTPAEAELWEWIRKGVDGTKFRRQHIILDYIADFASVERKIVIEIDGGYHQQADQTKLDQQRTERLRAMGYSVLRFTNEQVFDDIADVISVIRDEIKQKSMIV